MTWKLSSTAVKGAGFSYEPKSICLLNVSLAQIGGQPSLMRPPSINDFSFGFTSKISSENVPSLACAEAFKVKQKSLDMWAQTDVTLSHGYGGAYFGSVSQLY